MTEPLFKRLAILGLGLIGSSVARAAQTTGAAATVIGFDQDEDVRAQASALGFLDETAATAKAAIADADAVILCVPVGAIDVVVADIADAVKPGAIISDVGSVKTSVAKAFAQLPDMVHAIPAHPVAGTEKSGPAAGFASLFDGRWCIITPPDGADPSAVTTLKAFWQRLGAQVDEMSAEHHDLVLAITSHVPHLIAYNIVGTASDLEAVTQSEVIKYSAGGFRDFTRIAASDPTMWRDVFLGNKDAVLEMLGRFSEDLTALQRAIRWGDGDALFSLFSRTREIRRNIIDAGQETAEADFGRHTPSDS
ncbi:MAG: prephenate/arogenate dehydrogenase family protein [Pseudomonadota bacterium]